MEALCGSTKIQGGRANASELLMDVITVGGQEQEKRVKFRTFL